MRLGHSVTVFTCGQQIDDYKGVNFVSGRPFLTLLRNPLSFALPFKILKSNDHYDVIHIHLPFPLTGDFTVLLTSLLARPCRSIVVATYHFDIDLESCIGRFVAPFYNFALSRVLDNVDRILVSSKAFSQRSPILLRHQKKVTFAPLGIDTAKYTPSYGKSSQVVFVGRIIREKGIHHLINSMRYLDKETHLVIIGKIIENQYYNFLVRLSKQLGLKDRVSFTGRVSQDALHEYYRSAGVVVLPSTTRLESFGLILLEAMATGKPVIATNVIPGAVELIRNSKCGIIVPPRNPVALAQAIQTLRKNPGNLGSRARDYVKLFHDWGTVAKRVDTIYNDVFSHRTAVL